MVRAGVRVNAEMCVCERLQCVYRWVGWGAWGGYGAMGPGSRCLGSEPRAPGRHRFPDEMRPVCRCARRGMPVGTGQLPLTEGLGRDFADHMGVCVCVCGRGSGCRWLPRTDSPPPQTAGFSPQAAPSSVQRVPDLPSPKQEVFPENHPRLTSRADSAARRVAWNLIFVWVTHGLRCCHSHLG